MPTTDAKRVILTDVKPLAAEACPRCGAAKADRVWSGGFGQKPYEICKGCGYEFRETR